ncbi:MAG: ThuA domain-containing protein [Fuerstiella sp.]|nr:ThuA domain-containing protein [Fuerstiella sp.]
MITNIHLSPYLRSGVAAVLTGLLMFSFTAGAAAGDRLEFKTPNAGEKTKHIVLVAGDEEYRSEESMPMLAKILSRHHAYNCTVVFSFGPDGAKYVDPNNQQGLRGLEALQSADLMIIGTRFRQPSPEQTEYITDYLNAGRPVIGIRTATHAFRGEGTFGSISYGEFGRKILGEQWVSHHGRHKKEGARGVIQTEFAGHAILNGVRNVFAPSDVYGVIHLTADDQILLRGAVTASLDPKSEILSDDPRNDPMQPFAWLHTYTTPDGTGQGQSFCTTAGASVDLLSYDLRRLIVNAAYYLTGREVPAAADVRFVDPFYPSFYGFIRDQAYWKNANMTPQDYGPGKSPRMADPPGSPKWPFRAMPGKN